jgi:hypothetical protein
METRGVDMKLTKKQIMALSAANLEIYRSGLQKSGSTWIADRPNSEAHADRTIQSLVDLGCLQLFANGTCAHITDIGYQALS